VNYSKAVASGGQRKKVLVAFVIAIGLLSCALALRDIAGRSDEHVRGPKLIWRIFMAMNPGNSLFYWLFGRK
jgi:hypothetical protein